jgi:hypothetical protein
MHGDLSCQAHLAYLNVMPCIFDLFCWFPALKIERWTFQCASAVDNLAAFYFNNITMGEPPTSPAVINLARHIADCPNLFPEVSQTTSLILFASLVWLKMASIKFRLLKCSWWYNTLPSGISIWWILDVDFWVFLFSLRNILDVDCARA